MAFTREDVLAKLKKTLRKNSPIIIAGAGSGIAAKFEEAGGVDLIIIYNSGKFRMAGRESTAGLMPYGDANAIVMEIAKEILPVVKKTPVLAGVCGTDPFRSMGLFLKEIKEAGFAGVQNFPTVGIYDGLFRKELEETGISYNLEVEMIKKARLLNLFTSPYVFNAYEARSMAEAGADALVAHLGPTERKNQRRQAAPRLKEVAKKVQEICDAGRKVKSDTIFLCHGGPIVEPGDAAYIFQNTNGVHGFCGESSVEQFPTEMAIKKQITKFKSIQL